MLQVHVAQSLVVFEDEAVAFLEKPTDSFRLFVATADAVLDVALLDVEDVELVQNSKRFVVLKLSLINTYSPPTRSERYKAFNKQSIVFSVLLIS